MGDIILDPRRRRIGRGFFIRDLILPNIGAFVLVLVIRNLELGTLGDLAMGLVAAVLFWSANVGAPMARLHDLGLPGSLHILIVVAAFYLTTIGLGANTIDAFKRLGQWLAALINDNALGPAPLADEGARLGGLVALAELLVLCLLPGQRRSNRFGPHPRGAA